MIIATTEANLSAADQCITSGYRNGVSSIEIARFLSISPSDVTRRVSTLRKAGFDLGPKRTGGQPKKQKAWCERLKFSDIVMHRASGTTPSGVRRTCYSQSKADALAGVLAGGCVPDV